MKNENARIRHIPRQENENVTAATDRIEGIHNAGQMQVGDMALYVQELMQLTVLPRKLGERIYNLMNSIQGKSEEK